MVAPPLNTVWLLGKLVSAEAVHVEYGTAGSQARGSLTYGWPVSGVGEIVRAPGAYPPTRLIGAPLLTVIVAELPFELRAPPLPAGHAESTCTAPSKITVLLPENNSDGHPV